MLRGRTPECAALDALLAQAQAGESRVLVLRGEPGIGKTALLDYLAERAADCRVIRAAGVESEMDLTFAGLHQLCGPLLDRLDHLPAPQAGALELGTAGQVFARVADEASKSGLSVNGSIKSFNLEK